jgi:inner membrane transporter RhtA
MATIEKPLVDRVPATSYFVVSAVFHYLGPSFAVLLFAHVDVLGVAWLRIASAAVVFGIWRRPWRMLRDSENRTTLIALGVVLAAMNSLFYLAIDRLPLSTVGAIEFLGTVVLAAAGTRTRRNAFALVLAIAGVFVLTDVRLTGEPLGFVFAFANCAGFMLYVILGHRVANSGDSASRGAWTDGRRAASGDSASRGAWTDGRRAASGDSASRGAWTDGRHAASGDSASRGAWTDGRRAASGDKLDRLGASMLIAAVAATPFAIGQAAPAFTNPVWLLWGIGVGLCSSVIPYVTDQLAMARMPRATFALMLALLPATATLIGLVVLSQVPTARDLAGVALVVAGVAWHRI